MTGEQKFPKTAHEFFRYDHDRARARLHFDSVRSHCAELADTVFLIRDRAMDLNRKFGHDANWALGWFTFVTSLAILITASAIGLGIALSLQGKGTAASAVTISIGALAVPDRLWGAGVRVA